MDSREKISEMDKTDQVIHALHAFFAALLYENPEFYGDVEVRFHEGNVTQIKKSESFKLPGDKKSQASKKPKNPVDFAGAKPWPGKK